MKEVEKLQAALKEMSRQHKQASVLGVCTICGLPALARCYSTAGVRQYRLSGHCELCYDKWALDMEKEDV